MMISLPSKWIKANKLDKGSEISLEEQNGKLVIGAEIREKKEISIKLDGDKKKELRNILTHAYRKGFDKITILGNANDCLKQIKSVINDMLLGFEITDISKDKVIIENISEPSSQKYDVMLKKCFQVIEETQDLVIADFEANKFSNLEDIADLRKQHDRFGLFCRRLLVRGETSRNPITQWELHTFLTHIEHRYQYLYEYAAKNKIEKNKEILSLLRDSKEYFKLFKEASDNLDISIVNKINLLRSEYYFGRCLKALEKAKGRDCVLLSYIREIFRIMQIATSPILAELLEKEIS